VFKFMVARIGNWRRRPGGEGLSLKQHRMATLRLYALAFAVTVTVAVVQLACDSVPLTSPTGSTITITADREVLPLNGQATLRAVVIEVAGTPVQNGTVVNFTSTLGSVDPLEARTTNGIATAIFNSGSVSGTSVIHAFSGGAKTGSGNSSGSGVSIKIGAAAAGSMAVTATPPSVSQSGGTVTISALVLDPFGNALPGVNVAFSASTGALGATTALSDGSGIARTTLTTSQTATVTAVAGAAKADVQVTVSTAPTVTITVSANPTAGQPTAFTFTPTGGTTGNSSPRQIATLRVDFGDGQSQTLSNITSAVGVTHTYQRAGGYTVTATTVDVAGNTGISSTAIVVGFENLPTITLTALPNPVSLAGPAQGVVTFTATAGTAGAGAPPVRSVRVTLSDGTVLFSGSASGSATYKFSATGPYTVTATVTDANGATATAFVNGLVTP
jgi:hypothetical protein